MRSFPLAITSLLLAGLTTLSIADEQSGKDQPKEVKKVSSEEISRLVQQLGDDVFAKRKDAKNKLEDIGEPAMPALKKAAESAEDAEVRAAAKQLLEALETKFSGLVRVFQGHGDRVNGVAISADGKRALSASWDGDLRLWNLESGELIRQTPAHRAVVKGQAGMNSVALSPDGKRALTGGRENTMRLWDLETGKELRAFTGFPDRLWDVAFSPDGKTALSGCNDGTARLSDLDSGKELLAIEVHKGGRAWTVAFVAEGKQAIIGGGSLFESTAGPQASLGLWDLSTGKEIRQFKGHAKDIRRVAVSPDGKRFLSASFDGTVRLWEIETGKELKKFEGPGNFVESVSFTPDGKRAICCFGPRNAEALFEADPSCSPRMWDLTTGEEIKQFRGHGGPVLSLAVSGDGRLFVSGSADNTMRLWRLPK
jgi:WD40 repeat protein